MSDYSEDLPTDSFSAFSREIKRRYIIRRTKEMLEKNPNLNSEQIGKELGCSKTTVVWAFDRYLPEEQEVKQKIDLLSMLAKVGITSVGIGILGNPEQLESLMQEVMGFLLGNKILLAMVTGIYTFWLKFIRPKINDPKNELSEVEVITQLLSTDVAKWALLGTGILVVIPMAWQSIKQFINEKI